MAVSGRDLSGLWRSFASAVGVDVPEDSADGNYSLEFNDGSVFQLRGWRGEGVYQARIGDLSPDSGQSESLARRFMQLSLGRAAKWEECLFADDGGVCLWRRFPDPDAEDFSLAGIEKFLNRLDFWRREFGTLEAQTKRMSGGDNFIAFDQFG